MSEAKPYLSVILPAYNEEGRIADTLHTIKEFLDKQDFTSEVLIVDDGSHDLTTEVVKVIDIYHEEMNSRAQSHLIENLKNVGKGFSIARGMIMARGDVVLFTDADLSTPIDEFAKLQEYFAEGYDVVIGSRGLDESQVEKKSLKRKILSAVFNGLVGLVTIKGIKDTQCGFKAYSNAAAQDVAMLQQVYGFGFDVEHLYIAQKLGYKIKEVPVEWVHMEGSKVDPVKDSINMFFDLIKIRWAHRKLKVEK